MHPKPWNGGSDVFVVPVQHEMTVAVPRLVISFHRVPHAEAWGYMLQPLRGKDKHNLRRDHGVSRAGAALADTTVLASVVLVQPLPTGPLLARPAGADVFLLANAFSLNASPVGLSNRKRSFKPGLYAGTPSEYDDRALRGRD